MQPLPGPSPGKQLAGRWVFTCDVRLNWPSFVGVVSREGAEPPPWTLPAGWPSPQGGLSVSAVPKPGPVAKQLIVLLTQGRALRRGRGFCSRAAKRCPVVTERLYRQVLRTCCRRKMPTAWAFLPFEVK